MTTFFLTAPTFLLAQGTEGTQPVGMDSSVKAEKAGKETSKEKKKDKESRMKSEKGKDPVRPDMSTMPARP